MKTILSVLVCVSTIGAVDASDEVPAASRQKLLQALGPFRLSEPSEPLTEAADYVRQNRGAAAFVATLLNSQTHRDRIVGHFAELQANQDQLLKAAGRLDRESGASYRESLKFDVLRFLVSVISESKESFHFSASQFNDVYFSWAEGRAQSFQVVVPPKFSHGEFAKKKIPLFVQVFGSNSLMPTAGRPFIRVRPSGRGVWGYRSMSRYDVLQVIDRMKSTYNVDEDRIYLTGTSAGATGAMHAAACRQDIFAGVVPLVAFGMDLPHENFRNLPVRCEHGVNDWTSAICNVRVQFQRLGKLPNDVVLNEHPTAGHGIRLPPPKTMDWLFAQKRNLSTKHVVHTCEHPRDGRAYWLRIDSLVDPHRVARIEAKAESGGIAVSTENVGEFSLDMKTAPLRAGQTVRIDAASLEASPENGWLKFTQDDAGIWHTGKTRSDPNNRRQYGAGAAGNLFQGEPLLVVYGTEGDDQCDRFLSQAAGILARSGGPHFKTASVRFPVRADSNLSDLPLQNYNLLIVGTPENNAYLRRLASKMPFSVDESVLTVSNRKPLNLSGSVLSLHYFNPEHPGRLIYVVSPFLNVEERQQFLKNPRYFLAGSDGFKMIDQPDLLVRGVDNRLRREMQFGADWKFLSPDGAGSSVPARFADRTHLAITHLQVLQKLTDVDLALWWGPEDKGAFGGYDFNWLPSLDPGSYTQADYAVRKREVECMTGVISGEELLDIFDRWIATEEIVTWPKLRKPDIDAARGYRIALPMDLVVKLGNRRKTLSKVAPASHVMPDQVAAEMFR